MKNKHVLLLSDNKKFNLVNRQRVNNELTQIKKLFIGEGRYKKKYLKKRVFILNCSTRNLINKNYDFELLEGKIFIW